jgi:hypothetical protein
MDLFLIFVKLKKGYMNAMISETRTEKKRKFLQTTKRLQLGLYNLQCWEIQR